MLTSTPFINILNQPIPK